MLTIPPVKALVWTLFGLFLCFTCIHTVSKVMVILAPPRRLHRDQYHPGQPYHVHTLWMINLYGARIVTYFSVFKLWFTVRALASAENPRDWILFPQRLYKEESAPQLQNIVNEIYNYCKYMINLVQEIGESLVIQAGTQEPKEREPKDTKIQATYWGPETEIMLHCTYYGRNAT